MKKQLILLCIISLSPFLLYAKQGLVISIYKGLEGFPEKYLQDIFIPFSEFSDDTTIAQLKKKIASKANIPLKKQKDIVLQQNHTWDNNKVFEDKETCQYYNLKQNDHVTLVLPYNKAATFFRKVALITRVAVFAFTWPLHV